VDEAGRGPLAGPVVASAVVLKSYRFREVIDDSKALSVARRERAYREILEKALVGIGIVDEKTIDAINILQATRQAMRKAIEALGVSPGHILIDGRIAIDHPAPQTPIIGGDSKSLSIAAASIVAKVTRDRLMHDYDALYPAYGFKHHKGYPTRRHASALAAFGPSPIHRFSYAPVRRLVRIAQEKPS